MSRIAPGLYAEWRSRNLAPASLREGAEARAPAERLMQAVWLHQRLLRENLRTLDGRTLRVLHPGFHNREAGPDFRGAVLQFGQELPQAGDIEIDLQAGHWQAHGHHRNRAFGQVLLHVVWDHASGEAPSRPTLALKPVLDAPLTELTLWLGSDAAQDWPPASAGRCCPTLGRIAEGELHELLRQAARSRLEAKAVHFQARGRQVGWEPSLWEGLFRGLGYKHNAWPMQRIAELLPSWAAQDGGGRAGALVWQARLLGVGGLLLNDTQVPYADSAAYVRRLWDYWWRERDACQPCVLPRSLWCFHGLRPVNHPHRRLALAAHWLAAGNLVARLEGWLTTTLADRELPPSLEAILQAGPDDFWSWHWTLRSKKMAQPRPLLGPARITDLAVNVILPWLWMRATVGKNEDLQRMVEHRYFVWPAGEDNAVLRLARRRLLHPCSARVFRKAAHQQGLLQIVRDFCDHSNAVCADCRLPELLAGCG